MRRREIKVPTNPARRNRALLGHFRKAIENYTDGDLVEFRLPSDDMGKWYALLRNLAGEDDEFNNGEYIVELIAPPSYPDDPPEFYFYTPNGVYIPHKKVCVDMGLEHTGNYPATLGMAGFTRVLAGGIISWKDLGNGRHLSYTSVDQKKQYARDSSLYNYEKYPEIMALFDEASPVPEKPSRGGKKERSLPDS